ncbi:uncharacterized protein LOC117374944 isoform X2 [Periophthalmus magnuspinnatus]|uniref:uncharacterized protein LOC117374944 isoform X2 n=1 Tax=Periophthalmus magnuspinnatus TaxID=409849 RepID=UPI002436710B|nr:uncharacterized protein LOC117374944 isoform X2 [Periophthalmus magnuspinnatus]
MDPLDFLEEKELLGFLRLNKTNLSLMDKPKTFVRQLRDFNLISTDQLSKINRMKSNERIKDAVYDVLEFIETKRPERIKRFWTCAFKEPILSLYPTLRMLRHSLIDGSYACESALLEDVHHEDKDDTEGQKTEDELEVKKAGKKRKKTTDDGDGDVDDERPSMSTQVTPRLRKKCKKLCFSPPLKKGEKGEIWTWGFYKVQLPVTCGDLEGILHRDRLSRGEKCILVKSRWFTPSEFEQLAGKEANKNWKLSIRCKETPLGKLIKEGHLTTVGYKRSSKVKKHLFPPEETTAEETEDERAETEDESRDSSSRESPSGSTEEHEEDGEGRPQVHLETRSLPHRVLRVECGNVTGLLHTKRFASGTCGRSIRTETRWMTPVNFVKEASCQTDVSWKLQIKCEGKALGELVKDRVVDVHSLLCNCCLCLPDSKDLDNEKNDDECWICRGEGTEGESLVECDECPRSFHQKCHLPHVPDALLEDSSPWICTPCVLFHTLELYPELHMDAALSGLVSAHMLHCQYLLLGLYRDDEDCLFKSDPCHLPEYTRVIRTPMSLDQVTDKLQRDRYETVGQFVSDIQLIFSNCASYNRDNPEFLSVGATLKESFEKELNTVFKIQPSSSESESESLVLFIPEAEIQFLSDVSSK